MDFFFNSIGRAFQLIISFDLELIGIVLLSLKISGLAIILAAAAGLAVTLLLDLQDFVGKNVVVVICGGNISAATLKEIL